MVKPRIDSVAVTSQALCPVSGSIKGEGSDDKSAFGVSARTERIGRRCWVFALKIRNESHNKGVFSWTDEQETENRFAIVT